MTISEFVSKWRPVQLTERSASQQHFLDLCEVFEHPKPAEADPSGQSFTFERGADKHGGGKGWADVWKRGFFGWEYKGRHKNLTAAYDQLLKYREALENPPLLVVCDMDRIVIHTNFTATAPQVHDIPLSELDTPRNIEIMRRLFHEPEKLRPGVTSEAITTEVAKRLGDIAGALRGRGLDPTAVARFLDRMVFCLFAEDVGLLPENLFSRIAETAGRDSALFAKFIGQLFDAMAGGGHFGMEAIRRFNGNLFMESPVLELTPEEMDSIREAARLDWSAVDPSIFGTLFERGLDPAKRSQLGAQYTSRQDIETLVEPVVIEPLRREWQAARETVENLLATGKKRPTGKEKPLTKEAANRAHREARAEVRQFLERLSELKVLDPACGSGNFLYVTLQKLKDLEKEVLVYASDKVGAFLPFVGPWQFYGIEINPYAFDLAQTTLWIGYLQWVRANGFGIEEDPILRPMDNFRNMDAVLDLSDPANPKEPDWPTADFIVGNPPFLGNKQMRSELGGDYIAALWQVYGERIPATSDLSAYWFEKLRAMIEAGKCKRGGLLATTAIKQPSSRRVLERINETCKIFFAISDQDWILDGASVRISMVGFGAKDIDDKSVLDGIEVSQINADLTSGCDLTQKRLLETNAKLCFMGTTKVGAFDIEEATALSFLKGVNPNGRPNSDVLRPFRNGSDLVRVNSNRWIIDFGVGTPMSDAALYEGPFEYLVQHVKPEREKNNDKWRAKNWWLLGRTLPDFRKAVSNLHHYIATPRVAKHRIFVWLDTVILPDSKVIAIALSADISFGVLQSRIHEVWTLATCGWHGIGNDATYNPTACFETFPFPSSVTEEQREAIASAARRLDELRNNWLNPKEWTREEVLEFPGSTSGPWARYVANADERGIGTVRYPRLVPKDAEAAAQLARRTLTNLYNQRPAWLEMAHAKLDEAVFAAYGWEPSVTDEEILDRLLKLNLTE
jgi:type II restriction/modification system DNA methylase subunit YeeA